MNISSRNPAFSANPSPHAASVGYGWSDTFVNPGNGAGQPVTGNWVPLPGPISYTTNFSLVTGSQVIIPTGTLSWTVNIISGGATINGTGVIPAPVTLNGYSEQGSYTLNPIVVGGTGAGVRVLVQWVV